MSPAVATTPPPVDPYDVFVRTRAAVTAAHYPLRVDYTIAITGLDGATPRSNHYRASSRPDENVVNVAPISQEEAAQPARLPHGFNFAFHVELSGGGFSIPAGRPAPSPDLIAVPLLAPTYMFGLAYPVKSSITQRAAATELPVIAVVSTAAHDYAVTLADMPMLEGFPTYHLLLKPLRLPKQHRLRELWSGAGDYLPRKAIVVGNFTLAPLVDVPWTINFSIINGAPFLKEESAAATLYMAHRHVVKDATIAFQNVGEAADTLYDKPLVTPDSEDTTIIEP